MAVSPLRVALCFPYHLVNEVFWIGFGRLVTETQPDLTCRKAPSSPQEQGLDDVVADTHHEKHRLSRLLFLSTPFPFFAVFFLFFPMSPPQLFAERSHPYDLAITIGANLALRQVPMLGRAPGRDQPPLHGSTTLYRVFLRAALSTNRPLLFSRWSCGHTALHDTTRRRTLLCGWRAQHPTPRETGLGLTKGHL